MTHNSNFTQRTERERTVSRLRRDDPELAERVISNEVTSYEAQRFARQQQKGDAS